MHGYILELDKEKKKRRIMNGPRRQTNHRKSVSQWIVTSCQPIGSEFLAAVEVHKATFCPPVLRDRSSRGSGFSAEGKHICASAETQLFLHHGSGLKGQLMTVMVLVPWTYIYIRLRPERPTDDSDGTGAMDLYLHTAPA